MAGTTTKLLVAAIDFGTTYSGWAFSFENEYRSGPTKITCKQWNDGNNLSLKAPTAVLIRPDGRTLQAFGYDAEELYTRIIEEDPHTDYYFFHHFKMALYGERAPSRTMELTDEQGKSLPALTVFSVAIKYLREDLIKVATGRVACALGEEDIQWVLTVPAIWNNAAKHFMRMCAVQAGIKSENLLIALEPEAASLVCKHVVLNKELDVQSGGARLTGFPPGTRYLVLDAGGGTVDTVVHEVLPDSRAKELYKASGGSWGGNTINLAFNDLIVKLIGKEAFEKFRAEHKEDYLDLQRAFEVKKRSVCPDQTSNVRIKIPVSLIDVHEAFRRVKRQTDKRGLASFFGKVEFKRDKAVFDTEEIKALFKPSVDSIIRHIEEILTRDETKNISAVFMVGGFSESPMLLEAVRKKFSSKLHVITQQGAGLAVLKGAVMFGHDKRIVKSRISRFTYGLNWYENYDFHDARLTDASHEPFDKLVEIGESIDIDKRTEENEYTGCSSVLLRLFASEKKDPVYVDEVGCFMVGKCYIRCFGDVSVCLEFGDTEIRVIVEHEDGRSQTACFDFPS